MGWVAIALTIAEGLAKACRASNEVGDDDTAARRQEGCGVLARSQALVMGGPEVPVRQRS